MNEGAGGEELKLRKQTSCVALIVWMGRWLCFLLNSVKISFGFDTIDTYSGSIKTAVMRGRTAGSRVLLEVHGVQLHRTIKTAWVRADCAKHPHLPTRGGGVAEPDRDEKPRPASLFFPVVSLIWVNAVARNQEGTARLCLADLRPIAGFA